MKVHFCIIGLLAVSCNSSTTKSKSDKTEKIVEEKVEQVIPQELPEEISVQDTIEEPEIVEAEIKHDTLVINFKEFKLLLFDHPCYALDDIDSIVSDTINLEEDIGTTIALKQLEILSRDSTLSFEVFSSYSQTLRVYVGEKDFQDLDEWTTSDPFVQLKDSFGSYRLPSFQATRKTAEISEDILQITQRIKSIEGIDTNQIADSVTTISQLPLELWVYRTIIKINVLNSSGRLSTKYIINNSSWGC